MIQLTFLLFIRVHSIYQLNAIAGQPSFLGLNKLFNLQGLQVNISGQSLGYKLMGGLVQGIQQQIDLNNQTIISTSISEVNNIAILSYKEQYQINILHIGPSGQIIYNDNIFNITNLTCQEIYNSYYQNVIVHCIKNGYVILYVNNNFKQQEYNTSIKLNETLTSVTIRVIGRLKLLNLNLLYIFNDYAIIYSMPYFQGLVGNPTQVWYQKGQFIQLQITENNLVYALTSDYIYCYNHDNLVLNFTQKGSKFLAMISEWLINVNFVYLVTNTEILFLGPIFGILQRLHLTFNIDQAQLFSDFYYTYLLTGNETLIYRKGYRGQLQLCQFSPQRIISNLNVYSELSNYIVTFNSSFIQFYQLYDYSIQNKQPQQSGMLNLTFYNINGTLIYSEQLYINVVVNYSQQILPTQYQQENQTMVYEFQPAIIYELGNQFDGPELSFQFPLIEDGVNLINLKCNTLGTNNITLFLAYPLGTVYGYLTLNVTTTIFQVNAYLENDIILSEIVWQDQIEINETVTGILILETLQSQLMALLVTEQLILVYYIQPLIIVTYQYMINVTELYNISVSANSVIILNNQLLIYNQNSITYESFSINMDSYTTRTQTLSQQYEYLSVLNLGIFNIAFASTQNQVHIFVYKDIYWRLVQLILLPIYEPGFTWYTIPLEECQILMYTNQTMTYLIYYSSDIYRVTNIAGSFYYMINMSYSRKFFYIWVQSLETGFDYLNIYSCYENQMNQPYQSLLLSTYPTYVKAYSSYNKEADLLTYMNKNVTTIQYVPYSQKLIILPQFQVEETLQYNLNFKVLGNQGLLKQNLTIIIYQPYLNITNSSTLQQNLSQQNSSGQLIVNPYSIFGGAIQNYSVQCKTCNLLNYTQIIQNYVYYPKDTLGSCINQSDNNQLYISSTNEIFQYNILSQQFPQEPQQINFTSIYKVELNGKNEIILIFIEVNNQTLSWIYQNGQSLYVYSMINNSTVSMFIANASNVFLINYQQGYLQLGLDYTYNCYYYIIQNNTQVLQIVAQNIYVEYTDYTAPAFLLLELNQDFIIFGSILVSFADSTYGVLLNVTRNDNQLQNYKVFHFYEQLFQKNLFPLQQITLLGIQPSIIQQFKYVDLAYTTLVEGGRMRMTFEGMNLISYRPVCKLNLINSTYNQKYFNIITSYDYQVAVMNTQAKANQTELIVSLFIVDDTTCYGNNQVQPYAFQVLNNTNGTVNDWEQLTYLTENLLLLSYAQNTTIYQIQKYLVINYNTTNNSQINITATNPFNNTYQLINLTYYQPATKQNHFQWYWIVSICLVSIIILLGLIFIIKHRVSKQQSPDLYQSQNNEIEFK